MALHGGILTGKDIADLFNGTTPYTNLLGLWTFDNIDSPLEFTSTAAGTPLMHFSSNWEGSFVVVSTAPFYNWDALALGHIVLAATDTAIQLVPRGFIGATTSILAISSGLSLFQYDLLACSGSAIFDGSIVSDSEGIRMFLVLK